MAPPSSWREFTYPRRRPAGFNAVHPRVKCELSRPYNAPCSSPRRPGYRENNDVFSVVCFTRLVPTQPLRSLKYKCGIDGALLRSVDRKPRYGLLRDARQRWQQSRREHCEQRAVANTVPAPEYSHGADGEVSLAPSVYRTDALRASSTNAFVMVLLTRHFHTNAGPLPKQTSGSGGCRPATYYGMTEGLDFALCSKALTGCACGSNRGVSGSWCRLRDLNSRPCARQAHALPAELSLHFSEYSSELFRILTHHFTIVPFMS